jgi:predicted transcriptional regulator
MDMDKREGVQDMATQPSALIELAADIVSAYVSNNTVAASELPMLIRDVHAALARVHVGQQAPAVEAPKPAVAARPAAAEEEHDRRQGALRRLLA